MKWLSRLVFALTVIAVATRMAEAQNNNVKYCGIYSVFGAAAAIGVEGDFETLLSREFVSEPAGSTILDLKKAARALNVNCIAYGSLGKASLIAANDPLILHVAAPGQLATYQHWVLFLGLRNGRAVIVDSEGGLREIDFEMLLARWDGIALAVFESAPRTRYGNVEFVSILRLALNSAAICLAVFCLLKFVQFWVPGAASSVWIFGSAVLAIFVGLFFFDQNGIGQNSVANAYVQSAISKGDFPLVSYEELLNLLRDNADVILIDARDSNSFSYGMIPGAINIPVFLDDFELNQHMEQFDPSTSVVVYCQSSRCTFDETLGIRLTGLGFKNIRLYKSGWEGWKDADLQSSIE